MVRVATSPGSWSVAKGLRGALDGAWPEMGSPVQQALGELRRTDRRLQCDLDEAAMYGPMSEPARCWTAGTRDHWLGQDGE